MKSIVRLLLVLLIAAVFNGCYKQVPKEIMVPADVKVVSLDEPAPPKDEADVVIITHIKKASYLFSPRTPETPYTFVISIDGRELKEDLKGVKEVASRVDEERGEGIHYVLEKRLRVKPGSYEITLKSEDGPSARVREEISGGKVHTLRFEPVYGPKKYLRPKHFIEGLIDYKVYWDQDKLRNE